MPIVTFVHHKGGTGKTTSCLNIAGFLSRSGKRVLVIDCDPQANATAGLGVDPESLDASMYDVFMGIFEGFPDAAISDIIIRTASGIDLAPATLDLVGVEPYLYHIDDRAGVLKERIADISSEYDFILIDTPPSMGQLVINGLVAADHTIITLDPGTFALRGVNALTVIFDDIGENLGDAIEADMAILTRWRGNGKDQPDEGGLISFLRRLLVPPPSAEEEKERERLSAIENEVRERFKQVFVVPYCTEIYLSQQRGLPISHHAPDCEAGQGYRTIADAVLKWSPAAHVVK
ncbi:chromosome (plasmid) partitioning protein para / sporulation initiation inhibitor protein soj [hydrocarbon metagenome]|uniref:Chromosome (Plasmid) partitioning protein para / sporulation initiation inhibitor protein soj n=1 Tax=hydrocarbon metagenome TaxID=938273 RepID=A0A0W8FG43_9ZZZZ|nr:AAA family ATPase [Methanomicrobiaceae archaeon]